MKKLFLFILFASTMVMAQNISVADKTELLNGAEGKFFHPKFSPDGNKLLLTTENYNGLWIYDLNSNNLEKLNDLRGAGYEPVFSSSGRKVIFREDDYSNNFKESAINEQVVESKALNVLEGKGRNVSSPKIIKSGHIVVSKNNNILFKAPDMGSSVNAIAQDDAVAFVENQKIALYVNGEKKILTPVGDVNYIWPSVSPDNSKLLFTVAGKGTYVSDLEGNVLYEIGYANYPQWSADGNWIVYMEDRDDGYKILSSDIFISSVDGTKKYRITSTEKEIEMYPVWSNSGNKIAFNTSEGKIYLVELNID